MKVLQTLKQQWRIALVIILVVGSLIAVFGVGGIVQSQEQLNGESDSMTTLRFGLQLDGGTRIQAPLHGVTAEGVDLDTDTDTAELERQISENISNANATDVSVKLRTTNQSATAAVDIIEVTTDNVTTDDLRTALDNQNIQYDSVRDGVTEETRQRTVTTIEDKINQAGLSGGTARTVTSADGQHFILIEVPGEGREDVIEVLSDRGAVQIDIYYPTEENGERTYETRSAVLEQGDFQTIGTAQDDTQFGPHVPVTLTDTAANDFRTASLETGLAPSGSSCAYEAAPNETEACLLTKVDGEVVYSAGMSPSLAQNIDSGNWVESPSFVLQTRNMSEAQALTLHLQAGELPTAIAFDEGTIVTITATQGEHFKTGSLLIGIIAIFAVAGKVYFRYRDAKIAVPMIVASLSEVTILGGFAAIVGYPIDLAVVGGIIAVIGTGVDDLIIVANEVLAKGDVNSSRVFQSRFKKAFWVIGAAALTTAIALSPLMILSLGQLSGFAIFTIFGITVGVFITRPAYGDFLQYVMTGDK